MKIKGKFVMKSEGIISTPAVIFSLPTLPEVVEGAADSDQVYLHFSFNLGQS